MNPTALRTAAGDGVPSGPVGYGVRVVGAGWWGMGYGVMGGGMGTG